VAPIDGEISEIMTGLRIFILSLICSVAVATLLTIQLSRRGEEESVPQMEVEADLTSKNIHLVGDRSGLKGWELEAKKARHFLDENMTMLEGIEAAFYIEKGGVIRLKGDRGKILHQSKDIELQGNVLVFTADGYRLTTNGLHYFNGAKQITSSHRVDITGNGVEITGKGMSIDLVTGKLSMAGRVETVLSDALKGWKGMVPGWNR
jgi:LPS export ABC transporter protein LptC